MPEKEERVNLEREGVLFLMGEIDGSKAEKVCREIILLNVSQQVPVIQLIINSSGGYTSDGFAIIDIMEWSQIPVYTTGIGRVASMGLLVFISGEKGHRVVTPRTSILSHRYSALIGGSHSQLVAQRIEQDLMHQRIVNHYLQHSRLKSEEELEKKLLRDVDTWLTPEQTVEYGLADVVQEDFKKPYPNCRIKT